MFGMKLSLSGAWKSVKGVGAQVTKVGEKVVSTGKVVGSKVGEKVVSTSKIVSSTVGAQVISTAKAVGSTAVAVGITMGSSAKAAGTAAIAQGKATFGMSKDDAAALIKKPTEILTRKRSSSLSHTKTHEMDRNPQVGINLVAHFEGKTGELRDKSDAIIDKAVVAMRTAGAVRALCKKNADSMHALEYHVSGLAEMQETMEGAFKLVLDISEELAKTEALLDTLELLKHQVLLEEEKVRQYQYLEAYNLRRVTDTKRAQDQIKKEHERRAEEIIRLQAQQVEEKRKVYDEIFQLQMKYFKERQAGLTDDAQPIVDQGEEDPQSHPLFTSDILSELDPEGISELNTFLEDVTVEAPAASTDSDPEVEEHVVVLKGLEDVDEADPTLLRPDTTKRKKNKDKTESAS